ncbi:translation elongation factor Ts (EF-Ts) [Pseudidiomarina planktonica]|uniref:Elongation factor Ts n=1 Tax=Pseudidiomarina planktonica TaxID=1323738 RepID=A0A1Y6EVE2_9GAMM|nr:translation elongation factor Ts [Pseudidiomarina planktonica]RUO65557.1 elongation factor Ts [Pseudidiomarina planktonica]SMQ64462.1 translation elongation factor Ts (EF-Ts) [Pseudidiomarina planktonica]
MAITAALVKELRERTGVGMMDCKKALQETNGDIEAAIELMRKSGQAKAAKKAGRIAAEGVILTKAEGNTGTLVELNCETDFVARDENFLGFGEKVINAAFANKENDVEKLKATDLEGLSVEETRENLVAKIGENMNVRRVTTITGGDLVETYVHGGRIGVAVAITGGNAELAKDLAMHVAASAPQFVKPEDVAAEVVEQERQIQLDIAMQSGKPQEIAEKMVEGRMRKFTGEISLTGQAFVKDPSITVGQLLKDAGADVVTFIRFEVGEGIERKSEDFAAEVQAQMAAAKKA